MIADNDTLSCINEGHKFNVYNGSFFTNYADFGYNLFYCHPYGLKKFHFNTNFDTIEEKNVECDGFIYRFNHSMEFNYIHLNLELL